MKKNIWIYPGIILFILLIIGIFLISSGLLSNKSNSNENNQQIDADLEKYRSESIPEECRLPAGQDLQSWKEHLSHHQNTLYCLDYYE